MRSKHIKRITILAADITSWEKRGEAMLNEKADYLVLQEVRLCKDRMRSARRRAKQREREMVGGKPCGTKFIKKKNSGRIFRREIARVVKQGGV